MKLELMELHLSCSKIKRKKKKIDEIFEIFKQTVIHKKKSHKILVMEDILKLRILYKINLRLATQKTELLKWKTSSLKMVLKGKFRRNKTKQRDKQQKYKKKQQE